MPSILPEEERQSVFSRLKDMNKIVARGWTGKRMKTPARHQRTRSSRYRRQSRKQIKQRRPGGVERGGTWSRTADTPALCEFVWVLSQGYKISSERYRGSNPTPNEWRERRGKQARGRGWTGSAEAGGDFATVLSPMRELARCRYVRLVRQKGRKADGGTRRVGADAGLDTDCTECRKSLANKNNKIRE